MPEADLTERRALRILVTLAGVVIVIAGLRAASGLMLPLLVAVFLAILSLPPLRRLQGLGLPTGLAIIIILVVAMGMLALATAVIAVTLRQFQDSLPLYLERLEGLVSDGIRWLQARGLEIDREAITEEFDTRTIIDLVGDTAGILARFLVNMLLVLIMLVFMLFEADKLPDKLRRALGDPRADLSNFTGTAERVQKYLSLKALTSLATGVLVTLLTTAVGLDYPLLWGLVAFLFNFVPNIGSVIAAVPAILLALVQFGVGHALLVALGYLAINVAIGNGIEPRLMGRRLGLSPLVVFLSMVFWYWVWGPVGALLSVPLTVMLKIAFEQIEDLYWLAVLLGPVTEDVPPAPASARTAGAEGPAAAEPPP